MTESDFEYLFRTLSDARSRATELIVAVRVLAGDDCRLTDLGQAAVSNIEKLLREVRLLALDQSQPAAPAPGATPAPIATPAPYASPIPPAQPVRSEHWLQSLIDELVAYSGAPVDVSFETVERLVQQQKQAFLKDLETARRMYRVYPHLFPAENSRHAGAG
jgi:hypothetical protein